MITLISAVISSVIAAGSAIAVAIIETRAEKDRKRTLARAERRERESRLSMELMSATCELSVVTAKAVKSGHMNGDLEPALIKARKAQEDYQGFLQDTAAHAVVKM